MNEYLQLNSHLSFDQCCKIMNEIHTTACPRCILRLLCSFHWGLYVKSESLITELLCLCFPQHKESLSLPPKFCIVCLNIFRDEFLGRIPPKMLDTLKDFKSFPDHRKIKIMFCVTVDPSFILRDHYMKVYLNHKLHDLESNANPNCSYKSRLVDMRRIMKRLLIDEILANNLGIYESKLQLEQFGGEELISHVFLSVDDRKKNKELFFENYQKGSSSTSHKDNTLQKDVLINDDQQIKGIQENQGESKNDAQETEINTEIDNHENEYLKKNKRKNSQMEDFADSEVLLEFRFDKLKHQIQDILFSTDETKVSVIQKVETTHEPLYISGYYNKYQRGLPNSPFIMKGMRVEESVDTHICRYIQKELESPSYRFMTAGREDIDVRMLGNGRAFVVCLENSPFLHVKDEELIDMMDRINKSQDAISIRNIKLEDKNVISRLIDGAQEKKKSYRCVVWSENKIPNQKELDQSINQIKDLLIFQKTPLRVQHRRAIDIRKRVIHQINCERINDHYMIVDMETQAGTYVKEFVTSDFGRTHPSLFSILNGPTDILQLDVTGIVMDEKKDKKPL